MRTNAKQWDFCFAYDFAYRVVSAIEMPNEEDYLIDFMNPSSTEFARKISSPKKDTLLHDLVRNLNYADWESSIDIALDDISNDLQQLVVEAKIDIPDWLRQGCVEDHLSDTYELAERAIKNIAEATFHLLFADRYFLVHLQKMISEYVSIMLKEDHPEVLIKDGVIRRPRSIPSWLRNAVFHRDKGRCQFCLRDMTGLITPQYEREIHLDHMIPLNSGGTNDPTNFQLVCASCNAYKKDKNIATKPYTFPYW